MYTVVVCDTESFHRAIASADVIVMSFSREAVEACEIADALERLCVLSGSASYARRFASSMFIEFRGYDDDPREIYEIPACRRFFQLVAAAWPGIAHFLEKTGPTISVALSLLLSVRSTRAGGGTVGCVLVEPDEIPTLVERLYVSMNVLYAQLGLREDECEVMSHAFAAAIERAFGG